MHALQQKCTRRLGAVHAIVLYAVRLLSNKLIMKSTTIGTTKGATATIAPSPALATSSSSKAKRDRTLLWIFGGIALISLTTIWNAGEAPITTVTTADKAKQLWIQDAHHHSIKLRARAKDDSTTTSTSTNKFTALSAESRHDEPFFLDSALDTSAAIQTSIMDAVDGDHRQTIRKNDSSNGDEHNSSPECRYEGHCPVTTTCAVNNNNNTLHLQHLPGTCEPYEPDDLDKNGNKKNNDNSISHNPCIATCMEELKWDEQFYFDSKVNVEHTWTSTSNKNARPDGCIIQYYRSPQEPWTNFSIDAWKDAVQHHHIVRVDPVRDDQQRQAWRAFCYAPCQDNGNCGTHFECIHQQCVRSESYWTPTNATKDDMVIVTGATSQYFPALVNLVASCLYWAPQHKVVIYNLGMKPEEMKKAQSWPNVKEIKWSQGFPPHFPEHVHHGKQYAWKPLAMNESVHEYGNIFWLDAGNTLTGPMEPAERIVHETGIFLVRGQDSSMQEKSHPATYEYLGFNKSTFLSGPHYSGNTQAYLYPSRYIDQVVIPNAKCAMDPDCITPSGHNLRNHRYDQTTLSVLVYQQHVMVPARTEYLAAGANQLSKDLKLQSFMFVWTARGTCSFYKRLMGFDI